MSHTAMERHTVFNSSMPNGHVQVRGVQLGSQQYKSLYKPSPVLHKSFSWDDECACPELCQGTMRVWAAMQVPIKVEGF